MTLWIASTSVIDVTREGSKPGRQGTAAGVGERQRLLVVEDDKPLALALLRAFTKAGYDVRVVDSGEAALYVLDTEEFDQVVLDIGLPGIDGFEVLRRIRREGMGLPVLILTARDSLHDRLFGLNLGADDYVTKPFAISELVVRIRALSRRGSARLEHKLVNGPLMMDLEGQRTFVNGEPVDFPRREWTVLKMLLARVDKVVSKEMIVKAVMEADGEKISDNAIDIYISRLRTKLQQPGVQIRTVRGFGYVMHGYRARRGASSAK